MADLFYLQIPLDVVLSISVLSPILRVDTHATLTAFSGGTIDGFL